jgi:hypothetical protein
VRVVFLSCIPGTAIRDCLERLETRMSVRGKTIRHIVLEKLWYDTPFARSHGLTRNAEILSRRYEDVVRICSEALRIAISELSQPPVMDLAIVAFHPVLYHQITEEFLSPYTPSQLNELLSDEHKAATAFVSVQDEVFDVYRRLLEPYGTFGPDESSARRRELIKDISDQRLILDWRDRELTAARALAAGCSCRYLLVHRRTNADHILDILVERKAFAYLSHPISQPRRDITGITEAGKNESVSEARGRKLIEEIDAFGDDLGEILPIIVPTTLDELRIDFAALEKAERSQYKGAILPPVTERWPVRNDRVRLGLPYGEPHGDKGFPPCLHLASFEPHGEPKELTSALNLLAEEMRRQINVRDQILADQADVIVAFRPFSKPDSPEPTGGVFAEIEAMRRKIESDPQSQSALSPKVLILHPRDDESRRRRNEFKAFWSNWTDSFDGDWRDLRAKLEALVCDPAQAIDRDKLVRQVIDLVLGSRVPIRPRADSSSMPKLKLVRSHNAVDDFADALVNRSSVLQSALHALAASTPWLRFFETDRLSPEVREVLRAPTETAKGTADEN